MSTNDTDDERSLYLSEATGVTQLDSHKYSAKLSAGYCVGTVPNGGYTASVLLAAARAHLSSGPHPQPDPITAHISFINRTEVGPAIIVITDVKRGRTTSVLSLTLYQAHLLPKKPWITSQSRKCLVAYTTSSNITQEIGFTLPTSFALDVPPPPPQQRDDEKRWVRARDVLPDFHTTGLRYEGWEPPAQVEHYHGKSIMEYWVRPTPGGVNHWTNSSLAFAADCKAHMLENYWRPKGVAADEEGWFPEDAGLLWYPTLVTNLDIKKRLPDDGVEWLYLRYETKRVQGGRFDIDVMVCDEKGESVMVANHVNLIVGGDKNLGKTAPRESKI